MQHVSFFFLAAWLEKKRLITRSLKKLRGCGDENLWRRDLDDIQLTILFITKI